MRIAAVVLGSFLSFGLLACSGGANKKVEEFADKICACKDMECVTKATTEMGEWAQKNQDAKGDVKEMEKTVARIGECTKKIMTGAAGAAGGEKKEEGEKKE